MEGPKELTERIENDVDKILKMYEVAAQAYPYENVHGERDEVEQEQRSKVSGLLSHDSPAGVLQKGSFVPLAFVYLMSRQGASHLFDLSQVF